jgi:hypothetical protein
MMQGQYIPDQCVPEGKLLYYFSLGLINLDRCVPTLVRMKELVVTQQFCLCKTPNLTGENRTKWLGITHEQCSRHVKMAKFPGLTRPNPL